MNTVLMHGTKFDLHMQVIWIVHFLQSNSEILNGVALSSHLLSLQN